MSTKPARSRKKWNKAISELVIQVPNEYVTVRKKVKQRLRISFNQVTKLHIDAKLKLPYEELKSYVNKHDKGLAVILVKEPAVSQSKKATTHNPKHDRLIFRS